MTSGKDAMNFNKVLALNPHPDDGELGAGGTIAKFVEEGKDVYYIAFSTCEISIPNGFAKYEGGMSKFNRAARYTA